LLSPVGYRDEGDIRRIIRDKSHVQGPMGDMVTWQSQRTQEYRSQLLTALARFAGLFGIHRPLRFAPPTPAGEFEAAMLAASENTPSLVEQYLENQPAGEPRLGGKPKDTGPSEE
jgi:hypothetical protein